MLKRTHIRDFVVETLKSEEVGLPPAGRKGLTLASTRVFDTLLSPPQFDNSSACMQSDGYDLPAIAVFTENETLDSGDDTLESGCFRSTTLDLIIELYACGKDGVELEMLLDSLEAQVRFKIFRNKPRPFTIMTYSSYAVRDSGGRRIGLRRLQIGVKFAQDVFVASDYEQTPF